MQKYDSKSLIFLALVLLAVACYVIYVREKDRRLPSDYNQIDANIEQLQSTKERLEQGEVLAELTQNWALMESLTQVYQVESKFVERRNRRNQVIYQGEAAHWEAEVEGKAHLVLAMLRILQTKVPVYLHQVEGRSGELRFSLSIVGVTTDED